MVDLRSALEQGYDGNGNGHRLRDHMVGVEALIRWEDPERGLVPPADFIPVAEELGLIQPIADWVVEEACSQSRKWLDSGWALTVGLNLSPRQLWEPELVQRMFDDAVRAGISRDRLVIEITETAAMTDWERTEKVLLDLRHSGFRLAIDDFGAGHSSLARLGALPADSLKIDRSFVMGLPGDETSAMMVTAIVQLAHNLGMQAYAEGIETTEQLRFVVEAGCDRGQGFLFSSCGAGRSYRFALARLQIADCRFAGTALPCAGLTSHRVLAAVGGAAALYQPVSPLVRAAHECLDGVRGLGPGARGARARKCLGGRRSSGLGGSAARRRAAAARRRGARDRRVPADQPPARRSGSGAPDRRVARAGRLRADGGRGRSQHGQRLALAVALLARA